MPADSDHVRRDALHAARSLNRIAAAKYIRRLDAEAKAYIENELANASGEVDGTSIGLAAARSALAHWGVGDPLESIESTADSAGELPEAPVL